MERRGRGKQRPLVREAAKARIETLYGLALVRVRVGDLELARRYIGLARKIGMRYTVRIPGEMKLMTCKVCDSPLVPGLTGRFRNHSERTVVTCLNCGSVKRYPFSKGGANDEGHRAEEEGDDDKIDHADREGRHDGEHGH